MFQKGTMEVAKLPLITTVVSCKLCLKYILPFEGFGKKCSCCSFNNSVCDKCHSVDKKAIYRCSKCKKELTYGYMS